MPWVPFMLFKSKWAPDPSFKFMGWCISQNIVLWQDRTANVLKQRREHITRTAQSVKENKNRGKIFQLREGSGWSYHTFITNSRVAPVGLLFILLFCLYLVAHRQVAKQVNAISSPFYQKQHLFLDTLIYGKAGRATRWERWRQMPRLLLSSDSDWHVMCLPLQLAMHSGG